MAEFDPKACFTRSPVARLATVAPGGLPHLVPVVFAVAADTGDVIYTAVDAKPKATRRLRRLANIEDNPRVSLLVDHYADGLATVHTDGDAVDLGRRLLRAKYPQYQSVSLDGPVIEVAVQRWSSWHY